MLDFLKRMIGRGNGLARSVNLDRVSMSQDVPNQSKPMLGSQTNQHFGSTNMLGDQLEILGVFNPRLVGVRDKLLMRQDPDIAFGLAIITSPILNLEYTIQSDEPVIKEFVQMAVDRIYRRFALGMSTAVGFGWQAAEKVWKISDEVVEILNDKGEIERHMLPNSWVIEKTKALDPQTVSLLIDQKKDQWAGIEQNFHKIGQKQNKRIGLFNSLLWSFRSEQVWGNLRGWPLMWQAYSAWWAYIATDLFCNRYFQRKGDPGYKARAGATILKAGAEIDGFEYMATQTQLAQSSGSVVLPNMRDPVSGEPMFDIEEMSAQQRGDMFDRRLQYLSTQKLRALWITDRVGTAAGGGGIGTGESEVHQDTFLMLADQITREFVADVLNKQVVDQLVFMNFGEQALKTSRTKAVASGLSPATRETFKGLITQILQQEAILDDGGTLKLADMIDGVGVLKSMGIPLKPQEELDKLAADKQQRDTTVVNTGHDDGPLNDGDEVDDAKVTKDLEDEGILESGHEPDDTKLATSMRSLELGIGDRKITIDGDQVGHVLAIIKAAAAWEIPRGAASEALTLMGIDHADKLLGNAGKGDKPEKPSPADPPPTVTVQLPDNIASELKLTMEKIGVMVESIKICLADRGD